MSIATGENPKIYNAFPVEVPLELFRGDNFVSPTMSIYEGATTNPPVTMTGWTAQFIIFDRAGATLLSRTETSGVTVTSTNIKFAITDTQTQALEKSTSNSYLFRVTKTDGTKLTLLYGKCTVRGVP